MASPIEKSVQEATDELHAKKESGEVKVNTPERSIVRKAVSSIDEDMEHDELETVDAGIDEKSHETGHKGHVEESSESGSIVSRVLSLFGHDEPEHLEAEPVHHDREVDLELDTEDSDVEEHLDEVKTINSPEEIGSVKSLDELHERHEVDRQNIQETDKEAEKALEEELGITGEETPESTDDLGEQEELEEQETDEVEELDEEVPEVTEEKDTEGQEMDAEEQVETEKLETGTEVETGEPADIEENTAKSRSDKQDILEENLNDLENMISGGESQDDVRERLRELEEKIVSEESRELAKINELEKRVEELELENTEDLDRKLARLEDRVESIKTPQEIDDRLTELEDLVMNPERNIRDIVDEELRDRVDKLTDTVEDEKEVLEAEVERLANDQEEIRDSLSDIRATMEEFQSEVTALREEAAGNEVEELDDKIERLWEAMDEEMVELEKRIHGNEDEVDELMSTMVELSELVKTAMDQ